VNLGYKAGNEAVMVLLGQGIANAFPRDYRGNERRTLPIMQQVRDYSSFPLLVNISAGYPAPRSGCSRCRAVPLPMVAGVTAVSAPEYYPYLQSGQLRGLLGGMAGAAEYELARHEKGSRHAGMDAQSLGHLLVALCIVLGNVDRVGSEGGAMSLHVSHDVRRLVRGGADAVHLQLPLQGQPVLQVRRAPVRRRVGRLHIILNYWTVIDREPDPAARPGVPRHGRAPETPACFAAQQGDYRCGCVIPAIFGALLFTRLIPRIGWMSRLALAVIIGVYAGIKTTGLRAGRLRRAGAGEPQPLWKRQTGATRERDRVHRRAHHLAAVLLLQPRAQGRARRRRRARRVLPDGGFGAGYGYTVMSRISLLIGRFLFLLTPGSGCADGRSAAGVRAARRAMILVDAREWREHAARRAAARADERRAPAPRSLCSGCSRSIGRHHARPPRADPRLPRPRALPRGRHRWAVRRRGARDLPREDGRTRSPRDRRSGVGRHSA
jgi:hypothetical protein